MDTGRNCPGGPQYAVLRVIQEIAFHQYLALQAKSITIIDPDFETMDTVWVIPALGCCLLFEEPSAPVIGSVYVMITAY